MTSITKMGWASFATLLAAAPASASVRVAHASPDAPAVDVVVNNSFAVPAFSNLPYRSVSAYASLPSATYNFKVVPAGASDPVVIDADLAIDAAKDYTVAAGNTLASITPFVFEDDNTLAPGAARVRFLHLSANAPSVDIALAGGGATLFDGVSFGESGGYITVAPGSYDLDVLVDGTTDIALSVGGLALSANTVYTVYALGLLGSTATPLEAVVSVDAVPEPGALALLSLGAVAALRRRS